MKIEQITIKGFKNLGSTTVKFNNSQITSLIAPNNYGKSNFLESLSFVEDFIKSNSEEKKVMMEYPFAIPINKYVDDTDFFFQVIFQTEFDGTDYFVDYNFEFEWRKDKKNAGARIIGEGLKYKENKINAKYSTLIKRNKNLSLYQQSPSGRCDREISIVPDNLLINKLIYNDELFFHHILFDIYSLKFSITNLMEIESAFGAVMIADAGEIIDDNQLDDGNNISKFLYNLKEKEKDIFELFVNSLTDLIPCIEMVEPVEIDFKKMTADKKNDAVPFSLPEKVYDLRVKEANNNQSTGIRFVSRGTKRIILILASAIEASIRNIDLLAFEELENSIHPNLFQRLLMILSEISPGLQILISSHSPYLVQYLPLDSIYLGLPNKKGLACFYRIRESKRKTILNLAADEDASLGDFLFDMMLQDNLDEQVISDYFEDCECNRADD